MDAVLLYKQPINKPRLSQAQHLQETELLDASQFPFYCLKNPLKSPFLINKQTLQKPIFKYFYFIAYHL